MFSAEQAFEASEANDPILLNHKDVHRICFEHGQTGNIFFAQNPAAKEHANIDAASVLAWLGY